LPSYTFKKKKINKADGITSPSNFPLTNVCLGNCYRVYKRLNSISAHRKPDRHFQKQANWWKNRKPVTKYWWVLRGLLTKRGKNTLPFNSVKKCLNNICNNSNMKFGINNRVIDTVVPFFL